MKYSDLKSVESSLTKLLNAELPIKLSYKLSKLVKKVSEELTHLEEFRVGLVKKYGVESEDGSIKVPDKKIEQFSKDFSELLETEIDDLDVPNINLSDLENASINLSAMDVYALTNSNILIDT